MAATKKDATVESLATKDQQQDDKAGSSSCSFFNKPGYPKVVALTIGNEFCERFCYYGFRAVLQSYFIYELKQSQNTAGSLVHAFAFVNYFMPVFGAFIADSYLGRFWTIFWFSILYAAGNAIMAGTALDGGYFIGALVGMFTIALGNGGIKPCVSTFGGDQYTEEFVEERNTFFAAFYITANAGALLSQIVTPSIRSISCLGSETCYVLAFGLPAVLMVIAVILFVAGAPWYRHVRVNGNITFKMLRAIYIGAERKFKKQGGEVSHFLDRAVGLDTGISQQFVDDVKCVLRVCVLFVSLPFFWALYDQQGSRWTLQAQKMNSFIPEIDWYMQAEQIQIFNGVLVLIFVPFAEAVIYPCLAKFGYLTKPLTRMILGCAICSLSFVAIGFIQIGVQDANDPIHKGDISNYRLRIFNNNPTCTFNFTFIDDPDNVYVIPPNNFDTLLRPGYRQESNPGYLTPAKQLDPDCFGFAPQYLGDIDLTMPVSSIFIDKYGTASFQASIGSDNFQEEQLMQILVAPYTTVTDVQSMTIVRSNKEYASVVFDNSTGWPPLTYFLIFTPSNSYELIVKFDNGTHNWTDTVPRIQLEQGGTYTVAYIGSGEALVLNDKAPNGMSIFWQAIPYVILTWGEVFFSITATRFTFSQAPESMRSTLSSLWLLTLAFGNVIDIIVIEVQIPDKAVEFFVFASLMAIVTVIFAIQSYFYKPRVIPPAVNSIGHKTKDDKKENEVALKEINQEHGGLVYHNESAISPQTDDPVEMKSALAQQYEAESTVVIRPMTPQEGASGVTTESNQYEHDNDF